MVERATRTRLFRGYSSIDSITPQTHIFDIDLVKQDLLNHFHTVKGERVMRPNFGSAIWDLLFEPFDDDTREAIIADVETIIAQETRVNLQDISIIEFEHGLKLSVSVIYNALDVFGTFEMEFDRRSGISSQAADVIEDLA